MTANGPSAILSSCKALIIGANGGIGSAVAIALAQQGVELALVGRNKAAIDKNSSACNEAGAHSFPLTCDITQANKIESTVNTAIEQLGG